MHVDTITGIHTWRLSISASAVVRQNHQFYLSVLWDVGRDRTHEHKRQNHKTAFATDIISWFFPFFITPWTATTINIFFTVRCPAEGQLASWSQLSANHFYLSHHWASWQAHKKRTHRTNDRMALITMLVSFYFSANVLIHLSLLMPTVVAVVAQIIWIDHMRNANDENFIVIFCVEFYRAAVAKYTSYLDWCVWCWCP